MTENTKKLLQKMTLAEKAALVSGHNFMYTNAIPSAGIPPLECSDGPHGLRKQAAGGDNGVGGSEPSTAFPTAATTANSWDPQNLVRIGKAMGEEARYYGVDVVLGPAMNIKSSAIDERSRRKYPSSSIFPMIYSATRTCFSGKSRKPNCRDRCSFSDCPAEKGTSSFRSARSVISRSL